VSCICNNNLSWKNDVSSRLIGATARDVILLLMEHIRWIHVLLKGERTKGAGPGSDQDSAYLHEFARRNLDALHIPILEFNYKNLGSGQVLLATTSHSSNSGVVGLILTSPRAVEWVRLALHGPHSINPELVFVVGPKTAAECAEKLKINCNPDSIESGSSFELAKLIRGTCSKRNDNIRLIYPKSSLADNTIETALASVANVTLEAIVAYETRALANVKDEIVERLVSYIADDNSNKLREWTNSPSGIKLKLMVNFIFFSPSGVDGFCGCIGLNDGLENDVLTRLTGSIKTPAELVTKYSCIGRTTELALRRHNLDVYCVASKPNANSLVEEILSKCQSRLQDGERVC
jgi:uroporphyrinogen-III synthase